MRGLWLLPLLLPVCVGWFWIWETKPFRLAKDSADSCDFESSRCDVTFYQASDWYRGHEHKWYQWLQSQILNSLHEFLRHHPTVEWTHQTGLNATGPDADHTTGKANGHYMFLHPDLNDGHHVSVLLQTRDYVTSLEHACLKFWYEMSGDATLLVAVVEKTEDGRDMKVLQHNTLRTGLTEKESGWKEAVHTLTVPANKPFKVAIIGSVRDILEGSVIDSVAIDDIAIRGGSCRNKTKKNLRRQNRRRRNHRS